MITQLSVSYVNRDHQQKFQCLPLYSNSVLNEASFNGFHCVALVPNVRFSHHCLGIVLYPCIPYQPVPLKHVTYQHHILIFHLLSVYSYRYNYWYVWIYFGLLILNYLLCFLCFCYPLPHSQVKFHFIFLGLNATTSYSFFFLNLNVFYYFF